MIYLLVGSVKDGVLKQNVSEPKKMVHSTRFERATFGSASQRSIQLSYECIPS